MNRKQRMTVLTAAVSLALVGGMSQMARAASDTWSSTAANGSWGTATNWVSGTQAPGATSGSTNADTATFNNVSSTSFIVNDVFRNLQNITFDSSAGGYTIGTTTGNTLKLSTGGTVSMTASVGANQIINAPIQFQGTASTYTFSNNATGNATLGFGGTMTGISSASSVALTLTGTNTSGNYISGNITNAYPTVYPTVSKTGTGTWVLSGLNTYSGATTISGGILQLNNGQAVIGSTVTVSSANGLVFGSNIGTFTLGGLSGTQSFALADTGLNAISLRVGQNNAAASFSGTMSGAGGITKVGYGTQTMSGFNTYTGVTTINGGILSTSTLAAGGSPSGLGQSAKDASNLVLNGGTLQITGGAQSTDRLFTLTPSGGAIDVSTVGNLVTFSNNGALAMSGTGARTLTLTGSGSNANQFASVIGDGAGGATSVVKNGSGFWVLTGTNTYTGGTTINAGTMQFNTTTAANSVVINSGGCLKLTGTFTTVASVLPKLVNTSTGSLGLNGGTVTEIINFNTGGFANVMLGASAATTYTGTITPANNVYHLGGGGSTLTLSNANALTGTGRSLVVGALATPTSGASSGTVSLSNSNDYDGATTVNAGTLKLTGFTAAVANSDVSALNGTTLAIDSAAGTAVGSVTRAKSLTLNSGTATVTGVAAGNTNDVITGNVTLIGGSKISLTPVAGTSTQLSAAGINRAAGQGTAYIYGTNLGTGTLSANVGRVIFTTAPSFVGSTTDGGTGSGFTTSLGIIPYLSGEVSTTAGGGGAATGTANTLVTYNAATGIRPLDLTNEFTNNAIVSGSNTRITAATTATASASINSLVMSYATSPALTINDGVTITNNSGAVLFTANGSIASLTNSGSTGTLAFGTNEGIIQVPASGVSGSISAIITGSGGLTKGGAGALSLSGASTYTGITTIQAGTVNISVSSPNGGPGPLGNDTSDIRLGAGSIVGTSSGNITVSRSITVLADNTGTAIVGTNNGSQSTTTYTGTLTLGSTVNGTVTGRGVTFNMANSYGYMTYSGAIKDPANLTGAPGIVTITGGTVVLSGINTFTGGLIVNSGVTFNNNSAAGNGGTIIMNGNSLNGNATISNPMIWNWTGNLALNPVGLTLTGPISLTGNRVMSFNGSNPVLTVSGAITNSGGSGYGITLNGGNGYGGTLKLTGANTFDGGVTFIKNSADTITLGIGHLNDPLASGLGLGTFTIYQGGTIDNVSGANGTISTNNAQVWNGGFSFTGTNALNMGTGAVTLGATVSVNTNSTTNALTVPGVIGDNGRGYGINKGGNGVLVLTANNTYSGKTTLTAGLINFTTAANLGTNTAIDFNGGGLQWAAGNTQDISAVRTLNVLNGNAVFDTNGNNVTLANPMVTVGIGGMTKSGAGTLTVASQNTYTGITYLNGGTLSVNTLANGGSASGIGAASKAPSMISFGGGTLQYTGVGASTDHNFSITTTSGTIDSSGSGPLVFSNTAVISPDPASRVINFSQYSTVITGVPNASELLVGMSVTGTNVAGGTTITSVDPISGIVVLSQQFNAASGTTTASFGFGNRTLTLTGSNTGANTIAGVLQNSAMGTLSLTKTGSGTWNLAGANTYTGTTNVSAGTLMVDASAGGSLASTVPLTLSGGTFGLKGNAAGTTQTLGNVSLTVPSGITVDPNGGSARLALGTLTRSNSAVAFINGTNLGFDGTSTTNVSRVTFAPAPAFAGSSADGGTSSGFSKNLGIIPFMVSEVSTTPGGGGTITGSANTFLTYNSNTGVRPLDLTNEYSNDSIAADTNTRITTGATVSASTSINSLVMAGGKLTINPNMTLTNASGAVLFAANSTIGGNGSNTPTHLTLTGEGIITVNNGVTATFAGGNNSTASLYSSGALTKAGGGKLVLDQVAGSNGWSPSNWAATNVLAGTLTLTSFSNLPDQSTVTVAAGATLDYSGNGTIPDTINLLLGNGNVNVGSAGILIVGYNNGTGFGGNISGTGGFTFSGGANIYVLSGTNTYTGVTSISSSLRIIGVNTIATSSNVSLANSANAVLDLYGTNQSIVALSGGGAAGGKVNSGVAGNVTLTITGGGGSFAGVIQNGTATSLALIKSGTGTQILSGANTYTGGTTITGGTLEVTQPAALPGYNTAGKVSVNATGSLALFVGGSGFASTDVDTVLTNVTFNANTTLGLDTTNGDFTYATSITKAGLGLTKLGANTLTLTGSNTYSGGTTVVAGTLEMKALNGTNTLTGGTLKVTAGAKAHDLLTLASSNLTLGSGKLDLTNHDMILTGGLGRELAMNTALAAPVTRADGSMVTTGVLTYQQYADLHGGSYAGLTSNDLLLGYTYAGDANLDGQITMDDYLQIDAGYLFDQKGWAYGDFNHDGSVDASDYTLIDNNLSKQGQTPLAEEMIQMHAAWFGAEYTQALESLQAVPEPASLALLAVGALGLLRRRKR